jgi:hippurate hydrolase
MGAEDFSYMLQKRPGCYFFLGNGNSSVDSAGDQNALGPCMLHNSKYDFNDKIIALGANFWVNLINKRLG